MHVNYTSLLGMMESVTGFKIQIIKCAFLGSDINLGEVRMTVCFRIIRIQPYYNKNVVLSYKKQCHEVK